MLSFLFLMNLPLRGGINREMNRGVKEYANPEASLATMLTTWSGSFFSFNNSAELFHLSTHLHGYLTVVNSTQSYNLSTKILKLEVQGVKTLSISHLLCTTLVYISGLRVEKASIDKYVAIVRNNKKTSLPLVRRRLTVQVTLPRSQQWEVWGVCT